MSTFLTNISAYLGITQEPHTKTNCPVCTEIYSRDAKIREDALVLILNDKRTWVVISVRSGLIYGRIGLQPDKKFRIISANHEILSTMPKDSVSEGKGTLSEAVDHLMFLDHMAVTCLQQEERE